MCIKAFSPQPVSTWGSHLNHGLHKQKGHVGGEIRPKPLWWTTVVCEVDERNPPTDSTQHRGEGGEVTSLGKWTRGCGSVKSSLKLIYNCTVKRRGAADAGKYLRLRATRKTLCCIIEKVAAMSESHSLLQSSLKSNHVGRNLISWRISVVIWSEGFVFQEPQTWCFCLLPSGLCLSATNRGLQKSE